MQSEQEEGLYQLSSGVEEFSLENGLKVLIKNIPTSSTASVWVFYRVGSRNEILGRTGSSHWCEHMLFKGGGKLAKGDVFKLISNEGGRNNAFTDHDLTAYFETLPKDKYELGLFIESERMAKSAFEPSEVESERQVVISEREGGENYPTTILREELFATAFHVHPYRWPVVGWKNDLKTMTRDDLFSHYKKFYNPNNATLILVGNIDPKEAMNKIRQYFSNIEPHDRPKQELPYQEPEQMGERTSNIVKPGSLNYLLVGYHIPKTTHKDTPALIVLSSVLGGWKGLIGYSGERFVPKSNRLYKKLVEGGIASEVNTYFPINLDPSLIYFELTIMPSSNIESAKHALISEIEKVCDSGPTEEEIQIAYNQIRAWHTYENDGTASQALTLGVSDLISDKSFSDSITSSSLLVSADDIRRVGKTYLAERSRTVCSYHAN